MTNELVAPCCSLGARPDIAQIDEDVRGVLSIRKIAGKYGVKKNAVERHRRCLGLAAASAERSAEAEPLPPAEPQPRGPATAPRPSARADGRAACATRPGARPPVSAGEPAVVVQTTGQDKTGQPDSGQLQSAPTPTEGNAHARAKQDPNLLVSRRDRVEYIADRTARGQWRGRQDVSWLARVWGYKDKVEVYRMVREAEMAMALFSPGREAVRQESIARLEHIERLAVRNGEFRAAVQARAEIDRIAGLHPTTGSSTMAVQVNVQLEQAFTEAWGCVAEALRPFPDALAAAVRAIEAKRAERSDGGATPVLVQAPGAEGGGA